MNRQGSIDGILEAWFLDGPNEMPDRVFQAVFDQVERAPQRRLSRLLLRFSDMSATTRLAAAGIAAVLVVGIGFAVLGRGPVVGPGTTASPSPSPSPSSTLEGRIPPGPLSADLEHVFLGPNRATQGIPPGDRTILDFQGGRFIYWSGDQRLLASDAGADGDIIELDALGGPGDCELHDIGRYRWSLSPGKNMLTLDGIEDDCATRMAALPGTYQRSACLDANDFCLGVLEPGTYASMYVRPDLASDAEWAAEFGAVRYTVPEGWANSADWPDHYALMRAGPYTAGETGHGAVTPDTITVLVHPGAARLHSECAEDAEPGVGTTRADLVAWLLEHPGLEVTQQADVTIDGNEATVLDLAVRDTWTETCDEAAPFAAAPVFFSGYHWALAKNDRMRVVLFDLPSGNTVAVAIDVESPSTFDALVAEAMPIVESFDFK
jgi:hypothetical protein